MLVAGLTGSIATGKSTVSAFFKDLGAKIVDADIIARQVVEPGKKAWEDIVQIFGKEILKKSGEIDRDLLGSIVFGNPVLISRLNEVVHPEVMKEMNEQVIVIKEQTPDAIVLLDVPLLIESDMHKTLREIIVVYCHEDIQLIRLMERDNINREDALKRIKSQMPIEEKRSRATIIIDNSKSKEQTRIQVEEAYTRLMSQR